jgi:phytoene dehydrogenase-like protein
LSPNARTLRRGARWQGTTNSPVDRSGARRHSQGIRLADGTEITAKRGVVSALEPQQTFLKLIEPDHLESDFLRMVRNFTFGDVASFRVHFALHEAPQYIGSPNISKSPFQRTITSMADIDRHFAELSMGMPSSEPPVHGHCWSLRDPTRAPRANTFMIDTFLSKLKSATVRPASYRRIIKTLRRYTTTTNR